MHPADQVGQDWGGGRFLEDPLQQQGGGDQRVQEDIRVEDEQQVVSEGEVCKEIQEVLINEDQLCDH